LSVPKDLLIAPYDCLHLQWKSPSLIVAFIGTVFYTASILAVPN